MIKCSFTIIAQYKQFKNWILFFDVFRLERYKSLVFMNFTLSEQIIFVFSSRNKIDYYRLQKRIKKNHSHLFFLFGFLWIRTKIDNYCLGMNYLAAFVWNIWNSAVFMKHSSQLMNYITVCCYLCVITIKVCHMLISTMCCYLPKFKQ